MPSPNSFKDLIRNRYRNSPVSSSLQIEALEKLCDVLRRQMKLVTLDTMGSTKCLDSGTGMCHTIAFDQPLVGPDSKWSLQTQGVFAGTPFANRRLYEENEERPLYPTADGVYKTFGLSRSGEWLLISVDFVNAERSHENYERAVCVLVTETNLPDIIKKTGISLDSIFHLLVITVGKWVHARQQLLEEAQNLEKTMTEEFNIFNAINNT